MIEEYVKKPIPVEVMRFTGENKEECTAWIGDAWSKSFRQTETDGYIHIETPEGVMKCKSGDYIICGVADEFYPCDPKVFELTYRKTSEDSDYNKYEKLIDAEALMNEDKTIDVLGQKYTIHFNVPTEQMPSGADGCMDQSIHAIKIARMEANKDSLMDLDEYRKKVLRHEIIHAFFYESGLWNNSGTSDCWGMDETITDWIAIQSPKMFTVFSEVGCI